MSKKKTVTPKSPEAKACYANGAKVFILCFAFAGPGQILEGEVKYHKATTYPVLSENGKITGNEIQFDYLIHTARGEFDVPQICVYPSFFEAAKEFGKMFVLLLK